MPNRQEAVDPLNAHSKLRTEMNNLTVCSTLKELE